MWGVYTGFVFPLRIDCYLRGQSTQNYAICVHYIPIFCYVTIFWKICLHSSFTLKKFV